MAAIGDTPIYDYGNSAGPTSKFQAFIGLKITDISDTAYRLSYNHAIKTNTTSSSWATVQYTGKLNGSTVWSGSASLGKTGWYADNGWIDLGWKSSGTTISLSMTANYTGGSGTYYESSVSKSYTVPQLKQAPAAATSCTLTETSATVGTVVWVAAGTTSAPIENQEWAYQKDDGDWIYAKTGNGTARSVTFTIEGNARYKASIQMENSVGQSSWLDSNYIYTKPAAPTVVGMNTGDYVNLTATNSAATWYSSNVWQVSLDGGSSYSTVTGETGATLKYTINKSSTNENVLKPRFRCAIKNPEGDQSDWTQCIPTNRVTIYAWVPEGQTLKGFYINDGMAT